MSDGSPKSLAATNLEQPGSLPTATSFRIQGLAIDGDCVSSDTTQQLILPALQRSSSVSLQVGVKNYWQSPLRFATGRIMASGYNVTFANQQFGWAAIQPVVFSGRHVIDINPLQNFVIVLATSAQDLTAAEQAYAVAEGSQFKLVASLKGLLRRPVQ